MEETVEVAHTGSREQLAVTLRAAFGEGLLSEPTLAHRLGLLFGRPLVDPKLLVGDLSLRPRRGLPSPRFPDLVGSIRARLSRSSTSDSAAPALLLGLDWSDGPHEEILVGRDARICDVVLGELTVSRRHARLCHREGTWILQDLRSANGTRVNGVRVGRSQLRRGDQLRLGCQDLEVD